MNCATTNQRGAVCKRRNELRDYEPKRRNELRDYEPKRRNELRDYERVFCLCDVIIEKWYYIIAPKFHGQ